MESVLIVVTVVSLGLAVTMSVVAWTLLRSERERAAARAEALEALAFEDRRDDEGPATTAAAVRSTSEPTRDEGDDLAPLTPLSAPPAWDLALREDAPAGDLFEQDPSAGGGTARRWLAIAAVGLLIVAAYTTASALRSPEIVAAIAASNPATNSRPIELLSLRHATDTDGSFVVTGFVQNPAGGSDLSGIEAVVYLFDHMDQYFATGRALLEAPSMRPGEESPFVVKIPHVSGVNRYRVAFRRADGVVDHVDRRGHLPDGTTGDTLAQPEMAQPAGGLR